MKNRLIIAVVVIVGLAAAAYWQGWIPLNQGVQYRNTEYGLLVKLPDSWKGFTIVTDQLDIGDTATGAVVGQYPRVSIRHPSWTTAVPRQDIPIDVFTIEQWEHVKGPGEVEWSVSAAPIPPSELARNSKYVFALPARYNYAFPEGFEEVEQILLSSPVSGFEPR
jgi:hypothetical protein